MLEMMTRMDLPVALLLLLMMAVPLPVVVAAAAVSSPWQPQQNQQQPPPKLSFPSFFPGQPQSFLPDMAIPQSVWRGPNFVLPAV